MHLLNDSDKTSLRCLRQHTIASYRSTLHAIWGPLITITTPVSQPRLEAQGVTHAHHNLSETQALALCISLAAPFVLRGAIQPQAAVRSVPSLSFSVATKNPFYSSLLHPHPTPMGAQDWQK